MSNYKKYIIEFLVIFLSISLSFLLEDYRHYRIKKDNVTYALKSIEEGLISDIEQLEHNIKGYDEFDRLVQVWLSDSVVSDHPDSIINYFTPLFSIIDFNSDKTGFEIFIETEGKEIIKDPSLRKQISKYFVRESELVEYQTNADDHLVDERTSELLNTTIDLGPGKFGNVETFKKVKELFNEGFLRNQLSISLIMWKTNKSHAIALIEKAKRLQSAIEKELEELR